MSPALDRDTAEREESLQLRLAASEHRYRGLFDNVPLGLYRVTPEGKFLDANPAFVQAFGFPHREAVLAVNAADFYVDPEDHRRLQASAQREGVVRGFEARMRRRDGAVVWARINLRVIRDPDGRVLHEGSVEDITQRKRLEDQLVQTEKLATLGELIAGIAHELNNPLAALVGHAQLLRLGQEDPKVAARADRMLDAAQRATRIVRNFLSAARRHHPERVAVSLSDLATKTVELLAYQLRVNNVEVERAAAPDLPPIAGDPHQLQQVILNLVNNAIQAMAPAGQGRLRVATDLDPDHSTIRLTVTDNGPGIPAEHLPRVMEPFFTTKPEGEGTGLGLTIAQGIVSGHGGRIDVESEPGQGATFIVTLPVTAPPAARPAPVWGRALPKGLKVLVVDDEDSLREMMAEALTREGARAESTSSGREALEILARAPVDVLVLDVRMPEMSGPDLWTRINETRPALARRTVFCTGDVVGRETQVLISERGCPAVSKPFEWDKFFAAVAEAASR